MKPRIGVAVIARPTFDVPYAEEVAGKAWATLDSLDAELIGSRDLLFDADAVRAAMPGLGEKPLDLLLVLQATFSDATMTVELAKAIEAPLALWSFPEPRTGGRLRLNTICGTNLAAHALSRAGLNYSYLHRAADDPGAAAEISALAAAGGVRRRLRETSIAVIGARPAGFDTCRYDADALRALCGVTVDPIDIGDFFDRAREVPDDETDTVHARVQADLGNLDEMEQEPLRKSLKVYSAMRRLADENGYSGLAVRCWPEFFTEFGGAACGPMGMMGEEGVACGCEADVFGTISSLILNWLGGLPAFNTDLVDVDVADDTAVFWHCGQAPLSMADDQGPRRATVHSNRRMPLLAEFALKPGRITIARLSQSKNEVRLIMGGGEMIRRPLAFSGTAGVARFDKPVSEVLDAIMAEGLEHHVALAYGEHRPALRQLASMMGIPAVEIT
jgi:L-fucose isomerase-like protein